MKDISIEWKDRKLINELQVGQTVLRYEKEETQQIIICSVRYTLFNTYADKLMEKALEEKWGIVIGGEMVRTIEYAEDQAVVAKMEDELQGMKIV